jgi:recombination protein RecA
MASLSPDVSAALASLRTRWGAAAPRVIGSLAIAPETDADSALTGLPDALPGGLPRPGQRPAGADRVIGTGFAALDAILGPGGVPRDAAVALCGEPSSGRTTLALRLVAEAQAGGAIAAWVDLARSLDPVEAVARGVRLEWLVVVQPASPDEGIAMAGSLLAGRSVDVLVIDLPDDARAGRPTSRNPPPRGDPRSDVSASGDPRNHRPPKRPPSLANRLERLAALARRAGVLLIILEPPGLGQELTAAVAASTALRLELARRSWVRLGRDVVGQRTEVLVGRNRFGPTGSRAEIRILYAEGGGRDACLLRDPLLADPRSAPGWAGIGLAGTGPAGTSATTYAPISLQSRIHDRATSPPALDPPAASSRPGPLRLVPDRTSDPGRATLGNGDRPRREPGRNRARRSPGDATRERAPARP